MSRMRAQLAVAGWLFVLAGWPLPTLAKDWRGFYGSLALDRTAAETAPDIQAILEQDIPRVLTGEERTRLFGVRIAFPREGNTAPASFYSQLSTRSITFPVFSLRFLRDMVAAYSWLSVKGYDLQPVTDYLCMIKYQWPERLRDSPHTPLEALGVPASALDDPAVMERFQRLFGSAIVFVLGHELGHLYHQHSNYGAITPETAQKQEQQADLFALAITQRMGDAAVGATLLFQILAHLEPFAGDPDFRESQANRTHPISSQRINAIADHMVRNADRFAGGGGTSRVTFIASELRVKVVPVLSDEGVQRALRRIGQSTTVPLLKPRRAGAQIQLPGEGLPSTGLFSGTFTGKWFDAKGVDFDVTMVLTREGDAVLGSYALSTVDTNGQRHTHGSSAIMLTGTAQNETLNYEWKWGTDYFGRGQLNAQENGRVVTGTWGYTRAAEGAGRWELSRSEP